MAGFVLPGLAAQSLFEKSSKQLPHAGPAKGVLVEDLNGDGATDLLFYGGWSGSLTRPDQTVPPRLAPHLWLNNGKGWLEDVQDRKILATEFVASGRALVDAAASDLDRDGDLDLVLLYRDDFFAQVFVPSINVMKVLINDGHGNFADATSSWLGDVQISTESFAMDIGDVDQDGLDDIVLGVSDSGGVRPTAWHRVFLGKPGFRFEELPNAFPNEPSGVVTDLVIADLNGDAFPEVFVTYLDRSLDGTDGLNRLYRNGGSGRFARELSFPGDLDYSLAASVADLDGDGNTDLAIGNVGVRRIYWRPDPSGPRILLRTITHPTLRLYLGNGALSFVDATARVPVAMGEPTTRALVSIDLDRDGDLDLFAAGTFEYSGRYLENTGNADFVDRSADVFPAAPHLSGSAIGLGDIDGDGDPEVVLGSSPQPDYHLAATVFLNQQRQLKADSTALQGKPYVATVHAAPGHFVQVGVSPRSLPTDLGPFGVLLLDPAATALSPLLLVTSNGTADLRIDVPIDPALRRMTFYVQAIDIDSQDIFNSHVTHMRSVFVW